MRGVTWGALVAGVLTLSVAAVVEPSGATEAVPSCQGQPATLVGQAGERLVGTTGDDVIVSADALSVKARAGDDRICVTGSATVFVVDGPGRDTIDTTGVTATDSNYVKTFLGPGSDRYVGGPVSDSVEIHAGDGDQDVISTYGGADVVRTPDGAYLSRAEVALGRGNDAIDLGDTVDVIELVGGAGRDSLWYDCRACDVTARLGQAYFSRRHRLTSPINFEKARVKARRVTINGGPDGNRLEVIACTGSIDGGAGNDRLYLRHRRGCTTAIPVHGRSGDDRLRGDRTDDLLYGGPGSDVAIGREGEDLCEAERRFDCEL